MVTDMLKLADEICMGPYRLRQQAAEQAKTKPERRVLHLELTSCEDCPHRGSLEVDTTGGIGDDSVPFCHLLARPLDIEVARYLVCDQPDNECCKPFDHECPLPKGSDK